MTTFEEMKAAALAQGGTEPESTEPFIETPGVSVPGVSEEAAQTAAADGVVHIYQHPQGKTIKVWADGSVECRDAAGRKKPTSATPEKLAAGHGAWKRVGP